MPREVRRLLTLAVAVGITAGSLAALPPTAALAAAPKPIKILPTASGLGLPAMKKPTNLGACGYVKRCVGHSYMSVGTADGYFDAALTARIAKLASTKAALSFVSKAQSLGNPNDDAAVITRKKIQGFDVLTIGGNTIGGRGWSIVNVYVRKDARVVWMSALTLPDQTPVSADSLFAKGKKALSTNWAKVPVSK